MKFCQYLEENSTDALLCLLIKALRTVAWVQPAESRNMSLFWLIREVYRNLPIIITFFLIPTVIFVSDEIKTTTVVMVLCCCITVVLMFAAIRLGSVRSFRQERNLSDLIYALDPCSEGDEGTKGDAVESIRKWMLFSPSKSFRPKESTESAMYRLTLGEARPGLMDPSHIHHRRDSDTVTYMRRRSQEPPITESEETQAAFEPAVSAKTVKVVNSGDKLDWFAGDEINYNLRDVYMMTWLACAGAFPLYVSYSVYSFVANGSILEIEICGIGVILLPVFAEFFYALFFLLAWIRICHQSIERWHDHVIEAIEGLRDPADNSIDNSARHSIILERKLDNLHDRVAVIINVLNQEFSVVVSFLLLGVLFTAFSFASLAVYSGILGMVFIVIFSILIFIFVLYVSGDITQRFIQARESFRRPSVLFALRSHFNDSWEEAVIFAKAYLFDDAMGFQLMGMPFSHTTALGFFITLSVGTLFTFGPTLVEFYSH